MIVKGTAGRILLSVQAKKTGTSSASLENADVANAEILSSIRGVRGRPFQIPFD